MASSRTRHPQLRPFNELGRRDAAEALRRLHQVYSGTITHRTPKRTFPEENIIGYYDQSGRLVTRTSPKAECERAVAESSIFIGANPVEVNSIEDMTYVVALNGQIGGSLRFDNRTLRLIGVPNPSEPSQVDTNPRYIAASDILSLLSMSVKDGVPLSVHPFLFDGDFVSTNRELRAGDWILHALYADAEGGRAAWLDARIIPSAVLSL